MVFARMMLGVKAPRAILVVNEFPRNAMGKVMKRQCAERLLAKLRDRRGR